MATKSRARTASKPASHHLPGGTLVHRYVILGAIGEGGMGVVYDAYDPDLARHVALKLLLPRNGSDDSGWSERLLREAQALAQLSHPNVIAVHDVGIVEGRLFLAMELVQGQDLRTWLATHEPTRAQLLDIFIQAGRGLAAAHAAGLIHRDFKPANVLVGSDGRVRVIDFGLARAAAHADGDSSASEASAPPATGSDHGGAAPTPRIATIQAAFARASSPLLLSRSQDQSLLRAQLTEVGDVAGTPAYMAPEQRAGRTLDARADQYSYCMALCEELWRRGPSKAMARREVRLLLATRESPELPAESRIPRRMRRILQRGLAERPEARFPDMNALLSALQAVTVARARHRKMLGTVAVIGVVLAGMLIRARVAPEPVCQADSARLAEVWNQALSDRLRAEFRASSRDHADASATRTIELIDDYTHRWNTLRLETCEATRVRAEQSEHLLDLRMQCLGRRLATLEAFIDLVSNQPSEQLIDDAVKAAYRLPTLDQCADIESLTATTPLPADQAVRRELVVLSEYLDRAEALRLAGRHKQGRELVDRVAREAPRLGYSPLTAEALYLLGRFANTSAELETAKRALLDALREAARGGNDSLIASIWTELVWTVGYSQARYQEGSWIARMADVALLQAGDEPLLRAALLSHRGSTAWAAGKYDEALSHHASALAIRRAELGPNHPDVAELLNHQGSTLYRLGRFRDAARFHAEALDMRIRALGDEHPAVGHSHLNLALALVPQQAYDQANQHYLRAIAIFGAVFGPRHLDVGITHNNMGELWWIQNRHDRAELHYRTALEIFEGALRPDHPMLAYPLTGLGQAYLASGKPREAAGLLERAQRIREIEYTDTAEWALTRFYLQRARWHAGQSAPAVLAAARAAYDDYRTAPAHLDTEITKMSTWLLAHDRSKTSLRGQRRMADPAQNTLFSRLP